ncbi:MAG TPA: hypothetical protein VML75_07570 [Kofleriaceae bacterium]|nr:hypothetical protein [Kofleriaceae bacterium]
MTPIAVVARRACLLLSLSLALWLPGCSCSDGPGGEPDGGGGVDSSVDAPVADAPVADAGVDAGPTFALTEIIPLAASRQVDTDLTIIGFGIESDADLTLTNCDTATMYDLSDTVVVAADGNSLAAHLAADPAREQGIYTVTVTNPDTATASLPCAFRIVAHAPPTVTEVVPSTAWAGVANDGILSDTPVTIRGTGFRPTPGVRWVKTDAAVSYEAILVGYVSDTEITAVTPSETLHMQPGEYHLYVTNPDLLGAQWLVPDANDLLVPGIFTITATPPPVITDVVPSRIAQGTCNATMTITGHGFDPAATAWYLVPEGTSCTGSTLDPNGDVLCPLAQVTWVDANTITANFDPCPVNAAYPIVVQNPDGQIAYFFSVEVRNSSDGHLTADAFEVVGETLLIPRWKHSTAKGFDAFSNGFFYVAGGQDAAGNVLGSVEISQVNIFGSVGPFRQAVQYGDSATPRVNNQLAVPRQGGTMVRVGRDLFSIGGATSRTDTSTTVAASSVVERSRILSYDEMAGAQLPTAQPGGSLPVGGWYYRVSALGPWGESLATREVIALNKGGTIRICWQAPLSGGATGYNIYRSLASDGRSNSSALLATNVQGSCFDDDGTAKLTPAPGNLRGTVTTGTGLSAGPHTYRVSSLVTIGSDTWESYAGYAIEVELTTVDIDAGNGALRLAWDPVPGATYRLYKDDGGAYRELDTGGALTATSFVDDGAAFVTNGAAPRDEIAPLPPGSLWRWQQVSPSLNFPREGLDGVAIHVDPATTGGVAARILVAGGRTDNTSTGTYHKTAESLAIHQDGTLGTSWYDETPVFTHARVYYALLTTQTRHDTSFPPPPEEPPGSDPDPDPDPNADAGVDDPDAGPIIFNQFQTKLSHEQPRTMYTLLGNEPVYVLAVFGDAARTSPSNTGRNDFEACRVGDDGHLACSQWAVQTGSPQPTAPQGTFAHDALLYFDYVYGFYGVDSEAVNVSPHTRSLVNASISRFPLRDLTTAQDDQVLLRYENANVQPQIARAYYQMERMMAYIYLIGGWTSTGPSGTIERHQQ